MNLIYSRFELKFSYIKLIIPTFHFFTNKCQLENKKYQGGSVKNQLREGNIILEVKMPFEVKPIIMEHFKIAF